MALGFFKSKFFAAKFWASHFFFGGGEAVAVEQPTISEIDGRKRDKQRREFEDAQRADAERRRKAVEKAFAIAEGTWVEPSPEAGPAPLPLASPVEPVHLPDYSAIVQAAQSHQARMAALAEEERDIEMLLLAA